MAGLEGQTFAGYEIASKLGQGGMGAVYRARQPMLNRLVALKVMSTDLAGNTDFVARFQREAAAAANLSHPNIVQVYAAGESEGMHFIAMEFVEGESLRHRLDRSGRMDMSEALALTVYVAQALGYAWNKARLIHRDIKPDNVFLSNAGEVKLGDLGLAKTVGGTTTGLTQTGMAMGSPHYIAPEQARAVKDIDFRADIYSLGCTLYHMLTGQTPYDGDDSMAVMMKHVNDPPPAIFKALPGCPMPLGMLVGKMLAKQRNARHQSYEELIADLLRVHDLLKQSPTPAPIAPPAAPTAMATPTPTPRVAKPRQKSPALIYALAGVVALAVIGGVVWWKIGTGFQPVQKQPSEQAESRKVAKIDYAVYDTYAGSYQVAPNVFFTVLRDGDRLMVQVTGQSSVEVFPESETEFFYKVVDAQLTFVKNDQGEVAALILHQSGRDQRAKKVSSQSVTNANRWERRAAPPAGARVLFDGHDTSAWQHRDGSACRWPVVDGALVVEGKDDLETREKFSNFALHVEFATPRDAKQGNSGVYLQGRYEIQILESFGKPTEKNSNGSIFATKAPDENASTEPDTWQTFDITFQFARFDADGRKTERARVSVVHNGKTIHDNVAIPGATGQGDPEIAAPGPIRLQAYGSPVRFRNITITPRLR